MDKNTDGILSLSEYTGSGNQNSFVQMADEIFKTIYKNKKQKQKQKNKQTNKNKKVKNKQTNKTKTKQQTKQILTLFFFFYITIRLLKCTICQIYQVIEYFLTLFPTNFGNYFLNSILPCQIANNYLYESAQLLRNNCRVTTCMFWPLNVPIG